ncbi:MAG: S-methyl-5-thioribose-1-phosphate isomerase, partial [Candidatus Eisenbacteria bacterium]|nr:S-methyl-5-thioribose-1-phosphate isomerase [Candidatus Eisenbacteria bacterium]
AGAAARLRAVRPTATNLAWAVDRVSAAYRTRREADADPPLAADAALAEARAIHEEDLEMSRRMGAAGLELVPPGGGVITHCNTGGLATGGLGTALAVVFAAAEAGREVRVFVDETRPLLQGARLTAWELQRAGIDATLLVDGAAASLLASGCVDLALVGADRVAANGDAANKIGTYGLALAAARHRVPFYVVAPSTTFDLATPCGAQIAIEQRPAEEVRRFGDQPVAPAEVAVWNPAFDVTPAELIRGWVTEQGLLQPPFEVLRRRA